MSVNAVSSTPPSYQTPEDQSNLYHAALIKGLEKMLTDQMNQMQTQEKQANDDLQKTETGAA